MEYPLKAAAARLRPGTDLRAALVEWCQHHGWGAACVISCVGSLTPVRLRFAGADAITTRAGKHEVLTLSGTLGMGDAHLHMLVADESGTCLGGHVAHGCQVFTTMEVVLGVLEGAEFTREPDPQTGFDELTLRQDK